MDDEALACSIDGKSFRCATICVPQLNKEQASLGFGIK
jgi:hypothetical protein